MKRQTVSRTLVFAGGLMGSALLAALWPSSPSTFNPDIPLSSESYKDVPVRTLAFEGEPEANRLVDGDPVASGQNTENETKSNASQRRSKKDSKVDPVKRNGPIFVDWPKPAAAILISGEQIGYLEPCGCAGLDNMLGGLMRRHTLLKQLRGQNWPLVAIDLGGQIKRFGRQATMKYSVATSALVEMDYQAVGFSAQDLRLPTEEIVSIAVNWDEGKNPLVAANVKLLGIDEMVSPFRVVKVGNRRIGITSILGKSEIAKINNSDVELTDPEAALKQILPKLSKQADTLILLSHAKPETSRELARKFPQFQLVVTAGGAAEPPKATETIAGTKTQLVEVGHKGKYVAVIGLYDDTQTPLRYQRVPLDHRFADSPEMHQLMVKYQNELETLGLDNLGLAGTPLATGGQFVGSAKCAECHTEADDKFQETPHAHALNTLEILDPPRHHDPECISCHVVGWNPQKYFPYKSGYRDLLSTKHLGGVGCENCHGPGAAHSAAEEALDISDELLEKRRKEMQILLTEGEVEGKLPEKVIGRVTAKCQECHDLDNSPDFSFKTYWPDVEHWGKE